MKPTHRKKFLPLLLAAAGLATASLQAQVAIPSSYAYPESAADTTKPGFIWNVSEVAASNSGPALSWAEGQLAGLEGPNLADPNAKGEDASGPGTGPNPATAPVSFIIPTKINFSIVDQDSAHNNPAFPPENQMPGLPGTAGSNDNIAAEALTYLDLPAGTITMGVRSDDGFRVTIGGGVPSDKTAVVVGQVDGGRGAADTTFSFVISKAGLYAARLLYDNGGGDASVEWYTAKGTNLFLINDTANGGIKAYQAVTTAYAYPLSVLPLPGSTGVAPQPTVQVVLQDGSTPIDKTKITLSLNGAPVTPTISRAGTATTVTYTPSALLPANALESAAIAYLDGATPRTNAWSFTIANYVSLPASAAVTPNASQPGFKFHIFANSTATTSANQAFNNDFRDFAEQSLNMNYNDWSDETVVPLPLLKNAANPAAVGSAVAAAAPLAAANAPAEFDIAGTINFTAALTPGLPATDGSTDGANGELLTYVSLPAGQTTFGVSTPDLFRVYFGSWDYTTGLLGAHLNNFPTSDTAFSVVASVAGVYPMRLVWNHVTGNDPGLSIYTVSADGSQHMLNDTAHGGLAAYRALASPSEPYIKFTSPSPVLRQLIYPSYTLVVNIADGDVGVDDSSPVLTLDGKTVAVTKTRVGDVLNLKYAPTTLQVPTEIHSATLAFKDKAGKALSETWTFMNLKAIWLPATPVTGDNFDEYPGDGTVFNTPSTAWSTNWSNPVQPNGSSWYVYSYTYRQTAGEDLTDATSDSYMSWVVCPISVFPEGDINNINPQETLNGQPITALGSGNFFGAESDNRSGGITTGQEQFAFSKSFDLSSVANPVLSWASFKKQNQDDIGSIEYSVDGGTTWLPVAYFLDGGSYKSNVPDAVANTDGTMDALTTMTQPQGDVPTWVDGSGNAKGGKFGDCLGAQITQALGPFISPRVNDDHYEAHRIEAVRLPLAAKQKDVRLRLGQLGTCSWYIAVDNIGFYDITPSGATVPTGIPSNNTPPVIGGVTKNADGTITITWTGGGTLQAATTVTGPWQDVTGATSPYKFTPTGPTLFGRIKQ